MRKKLLAIMLSVVLAAGSIGYTPVQAAGNGRVEVSLMPEGSMAEGTGDVAVLSAETGETTAADTFAEGYFDSLTDCEREEFQKAYLNGFVTDELMRKPSVTSPVTEGEFYRLLLNSEIAMGYTVGENARVNDGHAYDFAEEVAGGDDNVFITRYDAGVFFIWTFMYWELGRDYEIVGLHAYDWGTDIWLEWDGEGPGVHRCAEDLIGTIDGFDSGYRYPMSNFMLCNYDATSGLPLMENDNMTYFRFGDNLTVEEAIQLVYRYSNSRPEVRDSYVEMSSEEAVKKLELTAWELETAAAVPMMTYENMPKYNMATYMYVPRVGMTTSWESDFVVMAKMGVNLVDYRIAYEELISADGKINLEVLEEIDKAVRYAAKYGMHIRLGLYNQGEERDYQVKHYVYSIEGKTADGGVVRGFGTRAFTAEEYREYDRTVYATLARRYRDVPLNMLSFLLFDEPQIMVSDEAQKKYSEVCYLLADAIWEVTPGRVVETDMMEAGEYPCFAMAEEGERRNAENAGKEGYFDQRIFQTMKLLGQWVLGLYCEAPSTPASSYMVPDIFVSGVTFAINANSAGFSKGTEIKIKYSGMGGDLSRLHMASYDAEGTVIEEEVQRSISANGYFLSFVLGEDAAAVKITCPDELDKSEEIYLEYIWITYPEKADRKIPISAFYKNDGTNAIDAQSAGGDLYTTQEYSFEKVNANRLEDFLGTNIVRFTDQKTTFIVVAGGIVTPGSVSKGFKGMDTRSYEDTFYPHDAIINVLDGEDNRNFTASFIGDYDKDGEDEEYSLNVKQYLDQKLEKFQIFCEKYHTTVLCREWSNDASVEKADNFGLLTVEAQALQENGIVPGIGGFYYGFFNGRVIDAENVFYEKYFVDKDKLAFFEDSFEQFEIGDIADQPYSGEQIRPDVTVAYGGKALTEGTDYAVAYGSNTDYGTGVVMVSGKGEYEGIFGAKTFLISALQEPFIQKNAVNAMLYADQGFTELSEKLGNFDTTEELEKALAGKTGYLKVTELKSFNRKGANLEKIPYAEGIRGVMVHGITGTLELAEEVSLPCDLYVDEDLTVPAEGAVLKGNGHRLVLMKNGGIVQGGTLKTEKLNLVLAEGIRICADIDGLDRLSVNCLRTELEITNENAEEAFGEIVYGDCSLILESHIQNVSRLSIYGNRIFIGSGASLEIAAIDGIYGDVCLQQGMDGTLGKLAVKETMAGMGWQIRLRLYEESDLGVSQDISYVENCPQGTILAYVPQGADESVAAKLGFMIKDKETGEDSWDFYDNKLHQDGRLYYDDGSAVIEHLWDAGVVTKEPTTKEEGVRTYTCEGCGITRTEPIPMKEGGGDSGEGGENGEGGSGQGGDNGEGGSGQDGTTEGGDSGQGDNQDGTSEGGDKPTDPIPPVNKDGLQIVLEDEHFAYTGYAIKPAVTVYNNGEELTEGVDYTVKYSNNINVPTNSGKQPTVTIAGKGNLTGSYPVNFVIDAVDIGGAEVVEGSIVITAGAKAAPVLSYNGIQLKANTDFTGNLTEKYAQSGSVTVNGKGNYYGSRTIDVTVVDKSQLKRLAVTVGKTTADGQELVYDGTRKVPAITVMDAKSKKTLTEGEEYEIVLPQNTTDAGTVKFTVLGKGYYSGIVKKSYTIKPLAVKDGMKVEGIDSAGYAFVSAGVMLDENLKVTAPDGAALTKGKDFTISYSGNKKVSPNAKLTVKFLGNYKGSKAVTKTFTIRMADLKDNGAKVAVPDVMYKGKPNVYKSKPYVSVDGVLLKASDYTASYYTDAEMTKEVSKTNLVSIADGELYTSIYVKITGKGNFAPDSYVTGEYKVCSASLTDLSKAKVTVVDEKGSKLTKTEYTGLELEPAVKVEVRVNGRYETVPSDQYDAVYVNNVNKGKATVIVTGKGGKYAGSRTAVFGIAAKKIRK